MIPSWTFLENPLIFPTLNFESFSLQIVGRVLSRMESKHGLAHIEDYPHHFLEAVTEALALVGTVKSYDPSLITSRM